MGWSPLVRSMIASRLCAKVATSRGCTHVASPSGPRCLRRSLISSAVPCAFGKGWSERLTAPPMPHMGPWDLHSGRLRIRPRIRAELYDRARVAARPVSGIQRRIGRDPPAGRGPDASVAAARPRWGRAAHGRCCAARCGRRDHVIEGGVLEPQPFAAVGAARVPRLPLTGCGHGPGRTSTASTPASIATRDRLTTP